MKIHILGGPGSGKTTLAKIIAARGQVSHYDLDQLGLKYGASLPPYVEECRAILARPGWVSEGVYLLFTDLLLDQADRIVLLDVPWHTAASRIVRRHIINTLRGTNQYPGLRLLYLLLKYARAYYQNDRPDCAETIRAYFAGPGVGEGATPQSVLSKLEQYPSLMIPPTAAFARRYLEPYRGKLTVVKSSADQKRLLETIAYR